MTRNIISVDLDSCIGCHSCAVVCKQENGVGLGTYYNKVLTVGPSGTYPDLEMYYLPVACQHCDNPECVHVCPTGASYKREDGVDERADFENACVARFAHWREAGNSNNDNGAPCTRESLCWRDDLGNYGVAVLNAAWWGWQEAMAHAAKGGVL